MTKHFYPNKVINLYDVKNGNVFRGELVIGKHKNPITDSELLKFLKLARDDFHKFQEGFFERFGQQRIRMASICFFISVFGFSTLFFPVIAGFIDTAMGGSQIDSSQAVIQKIDHPNDLKNSIYQVKADENVVTDSTFKLSIPKINLESEIVHNVDLRSESVYKQKLKYGVAHANGSYYPGEKGLIFLFAHSTDSIAHILEYNAKFFEINKLEVGDSVQINFRGKNYQYIITKKEIINPQDLDLIRNSNANLILQTCWPLGTDWQRLVLFADVINT